MYIQNAYYKAIPVTGATFPLAAGTIVTANGTVPASAEQYFGIVPEKVEKMPTTGYIFVAVSGTIDLDTCGVAFTDAQIKALGADFNFVRAAEIAEPAPELPAVSSTDNGKILKVVSGAWAAATDGSISKVGYMTVNATMSGSTATLNKKVSEINGTNMTAKIILLSVSATEAAGALSGYFDEGNLLCTGWVNKGNDGYEIYFGSGSSAIMFSAATASDYPTHTFSQNSPQ